MIMRRWCRWLLVMSMVLLAMSGVARANSCAPAATQGTGAPADYKDYCWLDFTGYSDSTAQKTSGQTFSFTLPDFSTISMNVQVSATASATLPTTLLKANAVPTYNGAAFGNDAFIGIPGLPVLYMAKGVTNETVTVNVTNIVVSPPPGGAGVSSYAIIVADGESTNNNPESLSFTNNSPSASPWSLLATIPNTGVPTLAGVGTTTVTETGNSGGNEGSYVFGAFNNPTSFRAQLFTNGGLQGIVIGVRYASINVTSVISGARLNSKDQFAYAVKTQGGSTIASGATTGTGLTGFAPAEVPTIAASYPFNLFESMATGSTSTIGNYAVTLTCTNATAGSSTVLPTNYLGHSYTIPSLQYGDSVSCVFTNAAPSYSPITGTVYSDANHNSNLDAGETGTGVANLYVKLATATNGVCATTATAVGTVSSVDGTYSIPGVAAGNYCLILNADNVLTNVTPALPSGWVGTENSSGIIYFNAGNYSSPPQNFGLYHGATLTGTVFNDNGIGSGTANDGKQNGGEAGLANNSVTALAGTTLVDSEPTNGSGFYQLWIPFADSGTSLVIQPTTPSGWLATGGSAGNTGGTYARPKVTAAPVAGSSYTGVNFGLVAPNNLTPNGAQETQPGSSVYYAEIYTAASTGNVLFSITGTPNPSVPGWTQTLYKDAACSGTIAASDPVISAAVPVVAGQTLCLIMKQTTPAGVTNGASTIANISAAMTYTNASPALSATATVNDTTTIGQGSTLVLHKTVTDITTSTGPAASVSASPGDQLNYIITATNNGTAPLRSVVINDSTPAFTSFVSAACPSSSPPGITGCAVTTKPVVGATGALKWTLTGTLNAGDSEIVSYIVGIQN
ncbi:MAG: hypothetical protein B7Z75_02250 [Acidocella sp. 20-57-95]|nr:MAG: hypothetical protein B7Z75_02250 [Acidocella sp. 20-57-95]